MSVKEQFPFCVDIIDSNYFALTSTATRNNLYVKTNNDRFVFENILSKGSKPIIHRRSSLGAALKMRPKDFLASIPAFADFADQQLMELEEQAIICSYSPGEIIFRQGDEGDKFYVINQGSVDVLIQDNPSALRRGDTGRLVDKLTAGCYFGERALMNSELRAASIRSNAETLCFAFSRAVYEEVISNGNALLGDDTNVEVDWSKDHETRSLFKHIENILEIQRSTASPKIKRILYELSTAFTPELLPDEIIARMVMTVKIALKVDRVGLFVLSEDKKSMILKVSERSKGVRLPIRGLAGAVLQTNSAINIADAYQDSRFDSTMDRRTGYRTRQVLGVPLRHPLTNQAMGVLQVNNKLDHNNTSHSHNTHNNHLHHSHSTNNGSAGSNSSSSGTSDAFTNEQLRVLELAAVQLSELLLGRADVFIHSGTANAQGHRSLGQGVGDGMMLLNSVDLQQAFEVDVFAFGLGTQMKELIVKEGLTQIELTVSLHLALSQLCEARRAMMDIPAIKNMAAYNSSSNGHSNNNCSNNGSNHNHIANNHNNRYAHSIDLRVHLQERIQFGIFVKDLPRATRILFKLSGYKKKNSTVGRVFIGWAACVIFDFKGCLESVQSLQFFPAGEREMEVPITTTLNNHGDHSIADLSVVLAPSIVLNPDAGTPNVRVVHSMPVRLDPFEAQESSSEGLSQEDETMLDHILMMSYNPMSVSIIGEREKGFLWSKRYSIFNRSNLLPAFVMSIAWNNCEQVQELYDLLDLWAPPSAIEALQLLDRRFMDPKVRAYAVHCLEDLADEELALYLLQLCQQLKFENFVDSALARFLLRRALRNNKLIGHIYFWFLQAEVHNQDVSKRYIILLQVYIRNCGSHRIELGHQMYVMKRFEKVAMEVQQGPSKEARKEILTQKLIELRKCLPATFKLPLNPHVTVCDIIIDKCRVMESKKKPLWLSLKVSPTDQTKSSHSLSTNSLNEEDNGDSTSKNAIPPLVLMLKVGDDLRQDALIIQLLRVMDSLWKREDLEMRMSIYDCISTGDERGLLQVVLNATTLGNIITWSTDKKRASKSGSMMRKLNAAVKALSDFEVLYEWIEEQVDKGSYRNVQARNKELDNRIKTFMISSAAYCVASYVLGLGDRHNDNLMMTESGHFFHIDFGHILGNFKSKLNVKRERAPFVFTPAMKAVMKGEGQYEAFVDLCCDIYNILRENSVLLVSLFSLAIPCNLPELQSEKDVMWIYEKLQVGVSEEEAADHFRKQLEISLNTRATRLNDAAHMLAHA